MSKKEFYEKYIKDNRTEDQKMLDIIHANARKNKNDKSIEKRANVRKWGIYVAISTISVAIGLLVGVWIR